MPNNLQRIRDIVGKDPFVFSDTHFYHERCFSGFEPSRQQHAKTSTEFDDFMIGRFFSEGPVLFLGDLTINARKGEEETSMRVRLCSGRMTAMEKIIVLGNHDQAGLDTYESCGWEVVSAGINLETGMIDEFSLPSLFFEKEEQRILASHYPIIPPNIQEEWKPFLRKENRAITDLFDSLGATINLHGHTHSRCFDDERMMNVSIEAQDFRCRRLSDLLKTRPLDNRNRSGYNLLVNK